MSTHKVLWLAVQPTPYNSYLLQSLKKSKKINLTVYYSNDSKKDLPWKSKIKDEEDRVFNKFLGVDWSLLWKAITDEKTLFIIVGWNDFTKFLILITRSILNKPYCFWTDTIKVKPTVLFRIKAFILSLLFKRSKAILTTGNFGIKYLKESKIASKDNRLINFPFFVPLPDISDKSNVKNDQVVFLASGRLIERKGYDILINAFKECKDQGYSFKLLIAGTGPLEAKLKSMVNDYKLENNIQFLGWLEPQEIAKVRFQSDVFIHYVPSLDPFPVAVLESMAAGLPIIGSNVAGSVMDRVNNGKNGYIVSATEPQNLTKAIISFIKDPKLCTQMGVQSRKTAEDWPVEKAESLILSIFDK